MNFGEQELGAMTPTDEFILYLKLKFTFIEQRLPTKSRTLLGQSAMNKLAVNLVKAIGTSLLLAHDND